MFQSNLYELSKQAAKERFIRRNLIMEANRRFFCLKHQQQATSLQEKTLIISSQAKKPSPPSDHYQAVINSFQGMTFSSADMAANIPILAGTNIFQTYKGVIAMQQISLNLKGNQDRRQALELEIVSKLERLLKNQSPIFVLTRSLRAISNVNRAIHDPFQYAQFINQETLPIQSLANLLKSNNQTIFSLTISLLNQLLQKDYQIQSSHQKNILLETLIHCLKRAHQRTDWICAEDVLKVVLKVSLGDQRQAETLIQKYCQALHKILEQASRQGKSNFTVATIQSMITSSQLINFVNALLKKYASDYFIIHFPYFSSLLGAVCKGTSRINNTNGEIKNFFLSKPLLKYMKNPQSIDLIEKMGILREVELSLLEEKSNDHSLDWEIAIACLSIFERLFSKRHILTKKRFKEYPALMGKLMELSLFDHKQLRQQLNQTLAKMDQQTLYLIMEYQWRMRTFERLNASAVSFENLSVKVGSFNKDSLQSEFKSKTKPAHVFQESAGKAFNQFKQSLID